MDSNICVNESPIQCHDLLGLFVVVFKIWLELVWIYQAEIILGSVTTGTGMSSTHSSYIKLSIAA